MENSFKYQAYKSSFCYLWFYLSILGELHLID